jgi:hypothetical protein
MHDRLDDAQVQQFTRDAEDGKNAERLHRAIGSMAFEEQYDALKQIESANQNNRAAAANLPSLTVELSLNDNEKSETVSLRRSCPAFGPKGEPRNQFTHNFGANRVDTAMWAGDSILCPGSNRSGSGVRALDTPDVPGPSWSGKAKSGGGGGRVLDNPDVQGPPWSGDAQSGGGGASGTRPDGPRPPWSGDAQSGGGGASGTRPDGPRPPWTGDAQSGNVADPSRPGEGSQVGFEQIKLRKR